VVSRRLLAFSLLIVCYCILTNEIFPTLRHAEGSVPLLHVAGMMAVFFAPAFFPKPTTHLLSKRVVRTVLLVTLLLVASGCFVWVVLDPAFLYSRTLALAVGLCASMALWYWVSALEHVGARAILFSLPLVFALAVVLIALLMLLPEFFHKITVIAAILCAIVLGARFHAKKLVKNGGTEADAEPRAMPQRTLLKVLLISIGIGLSDGVIRALALDRLYELPDTLYLTYGAFLFLALLTALFFALIRLRHIRSPLLPLSVVATVLVVVVPLSALTWLGHRGLFVLMGTVAFTLGSFLLPILFAHRKSLMSTQTVCLVQLGLAAGSCGGYLGKGLLLGSELAVEVQILALFLNILLCLLVLLIAVFGMRQAFADTAGAAGAATASKPMTAAAPSGGQLLLRGNFEEYLRGKGLTQRQVEIALLAAKGYSVPSIASKLVISKKTASNHLTQVYKALDAHTGQELVRRYQTFMEAESG
jgi:DNA-binding CsgD family transcriptional regulator